MEIDFIKNLPAEGTYIAVFSSGEFENGISYWAYIWMSHNNYIKYDEDLKAGKPISLKSYGEIIEWGRGAKLPPPGIIEKINKL